MNWISIVALMALLSSGCFKVPLEISPVEEIEISKEDVGEISEKLHDVLWELDFSHPAGSSATVDPQECQKAYRVWLDLSFKAGYLLRGKIKPAVYAKSSRDPKIHECRVIDFDEEYERAIKEYRQDDKKLLTVFELTSLQENIKDYPCLDPFLNPDNQKVLVDALTFNVVTNSLTFTLPPTKLYTSDEIITKDMIPDDNALTSFINAERLTLLATNRSIPAKTTGRLKADFSEDKYIAEAPLINLTGSIVIVPDELIDKPDVVKIDGNEYFALPRGEMKIRVHIDVTLFTRFSDAKCFFNHFKEKIRKEDEVRKQEYEENKAKSREDDENRNEEEDRNEEDEQKDG